MSLIRGLKLEPVRWMTVTLGVLVAVEAANEALHLLPEAWTPYLLGGIAVLTAVLGKLARGAVTPVVSPRGAVTPVVSPRAADGSRLVLASMRSEKPRP